MGQLIEPTVLFEGDVTVGFVFIQGVGLRVEARMWGDNRHLSIAATRRLANTLCDTAHARELAPAIDLLREKADRLEGWQDRHVDMPKVLANLPVEGHA